MMLVTAIVLGGWNWYQGRSSADASQQLSQTADAPAIDAQRTWADVEALSFQRYDESDRLQARQYILSALESAGWQPEVQAFAGGVNVVARRSGTDSESSAILLAAHYDTVESSPGADDNATGVATVLETARLLGQTATPRPLELVLFDREEAGLEGSLAFAEQLSPDEIQAAIVMDMIGYACQTAGCQSYPPLPMTPPTDRGNFLAVIADQGHASLLDGFAQPAASDLPQTLTLAVPTLGRFTPDLMRSDHVPFWRKGIAAALVTDTANFRNPHYHQDSDTLDTLDRDFFLGAAQIVVNATFSLLVH